MKKRTKILGAAAIAALLATTGFAMSSKKAAGVHYTAAQLENIEALSDIELEEGGPYIVSFISTTHFECKQGGSFKCPFI